MDQESKNCGGVKPITGSQAVRQTIKKNIFTFIPKMNHIVNVGSVNANCIF